MQHANTKDTMNNILKNTLYLTLLLFTGSAFAQYEKTLDEKPLKDFLFTNNPMIKYGQYSYKEELQIREIYSKDLPCRNYIAEYSKKEYKDCIVNPALIAQFFADPINSEYPISLYGADLLMDAITYTAIPTIEWLIKQNVDVEDDCIAFAEESGDPAILKLVYSPILNKGADFVRMRLNWALGLNNHKRFLFILSCYSLDLATKKPSVFNELQWPYKNATVLSAILTACQPTPEEIKKRYPAQPSETSSTEQLAHETSTTNLRQALENYSTRLAKKRTIVTDALKTVPETSRFDQRLLDHIVALTVPNHLDISAINYLEKCRTTAKPAAPIAPSLRLSTVPGVAP